MKQFCTFFFILLGCFYTNLSHSIGFETIKKIPGVLFTENRGQYIDNDGNMRPDILFKGAHKGAEVYLRQSGLSYVFVKQEVEPKKEAGWEINPIQTPSTPKVLEMHRIDLELMGANLNAQITGSEMDGGFCHFYYPHCSNGIVNVPNYKRITYQNIYPNIDWVIYSQGDGLKYDFIVHPGGNPNDIKFRYLGSDNIQLVCGGRLRVSANDWATVTDDKPTTFQNENTPISSSYILNRNEVTFQIGEYDKTKTLVIDPPTSLVYATYYGGSLNEEYRGATVHVDGLGNIWIAGGTQSVNFPVTAGAFQNALSGDYDLFIVKFNNVGTRLYATYYGGTLSDVGNLGNGTYNVELATDNTNNVWIGGYTRSLNLPVTAGCYQPAFGGGVIDAFFVKFDNAGVRLYATYYGGADIEGPASPNNHVGITFDASNNMWICGQSRDATGFFGTAGSFQPNLSGGFDYFLSKFNNAGTSRLYSTYFGGTSDEGSYSSTNILRDISDNIWIYGYTEGTIPTTAGAFQVAKPGARDCFTAKFNNAGARLYSTHIGGSSTDTDIGGIATDLLGNIWLSVSTFSNNWPVTAGAFKTVYNSGGTGSDMGLIKLSNAGARLYCTYMSGSSHDEGWSVACDGSNNVWLGGASSSPNDFDMLIPLQPNQAGVGILDGTISQFSPTGTLLYSSWFGGSTNEEIRGIAYNPTNNMIWVAGFTGGGTFPVTAGAFQPAFGGGTYDAFLAGFSLPVPMPIQSLSFTGNLKNNSVELNWQTSNEQNTDYFIVERTQSFYPESPNAPYEKIGKITAAGYSLTSKNYQLLDKIPLQGTTYYRLKQVDKTGSATYSNIVEINYGASVMQVSIYPNPVSQTLYYDILSPENQTIEVAILDQLGKAITTEKKQIQKGINGYGINTTTLPSGVYVLKINNLANGNLNQTKFVKY